VFISSQKVLKISTLFNMVRVGIIGAGVVGLSTALCIKLQHPSLSLTIIADRFLDATTSDGAGGLFRPDDRYVLGVDKSILRYY
jgi:glycine/D-amino acid oxidase-like deaminating enzyme